MGEPKEYQQVLENLYVSGINFRKANVEVRSKFSLTSEQIENCYLVLKEKGFSDVVIISTCNRTEFYGIGSSNEVVGIILGLIGAELIHYHNYSFTKVSKSALVHIFNVASGLDSQILGDYEILGQFKNACRTSKNHGLLGPVFERMANICIQASKEIKSSTSISQGTVSASYAAIEVIKSRFQKQSHSILLIGTGKFGFSIAKNIKHYLPDYTVTISNRTYSKAEDISGKLGFNTLNYEDIGNNVSLFEIVIICTNSKNLILRYEDLTQASTKMILDLSVPASVDKNIQSSSHIEYLDLDHISSILDHSIEHRKTFLPLANEIIDKYLMGFVEWYNLYQYREHIIFLKELLRKESEVCPFLSKLDENSRNQKVNFAIQEFVKKIKLGQISDLSYENILNNFKNLRHKVESNH